MKCTKGNRLIEWADRWQLPISIWNMYPSLYVWHISNRTFCTPKFFHKISHCPVRLLHRTNSCYEQQPVLFNFHTN